MTSVRTATAKVKNYALVRVEVNGERANKGPPTIKKANLLLVDWRGCRLDDRRRGLPLTFTDGTAASQTDYSKHGDYCD